MVEVSNAQIIKLKTVEEDHNRTALVNKMQQLRINNNQRRANNSSLAWPIIYFCGESCPHKNGRKSCHVVDKTCRSCAKIGNFFRVCKSQVLNRNQRRQRLFSRNRYGKQNQRLNACYK